jgi:hypothetical protein
MDPRLREQLETELSPEVQRLGELLEPDLTSWVTRRGQEDVTAARSRAPGDPQ